MRLTRILAFIGSCALAFSAAAETTDCTVISSVPAFLPNPGVYCLKANINTSMSSGAAIQFGANFIVLDLNGFKLDGLGAGLATLATGIDTNGFSNATV